MYRIGDIAIYWYAPAALAVVALACGAWKRSWRAPGLLMVVLAPLILAAASGVPVTVVPNNQQLGRMLSYQYASVLRLGVNRIGDADPQWFASLKAADGSSLPCPIAGGDVGSQVPTEDGGCMVAILPAAGADVREWNQTAGDITGGTVDASATIQAAITALVAAQGKLNFGPYLYRVTQTLSVPGIVTLEGTNGNLDVYQGRQSTLGSCTSGFITDSDINLLIFTGVHGAIKNLCFDMAAAPATRAGGWALIVGGTSTTHQGRVEVSNNAIVNPYNGLSIGIPSGIPGLSPTGGSSQTNSDIVVDNTIIRPSNIGIGNGLASTQASTNGTEFRGNQIVCFGAGGKNSIGFQFSDGGAFVDNANGGPYQCGHGMIITEGPSQVLGGGIFRSVLCDSSLVDCLTVDSTGGTVYLASFSNFWAGNVPTATGNTVILRDHAGAGNVHKLTFSAGIIQVDTRANASGGALDAIDIEDDVYAVTFNANQINENGNGAHHDVGIHIGGSAQEIGLIGNDFTSASSFFAAAVQLAGSGDLFTMVGNNFAGAGGPTSGGGNGYEPLDLSSWSSLTRRMTAAGNLPIDSGSGAMVTVDASNRLTLGTYHAYGVANVTATSNLLAPWWNGRVAMLTPLGANTVTLATGGVAGSGYIPYCNAASLSSAIGFLWIVADYNGGTPCWRLK